MLLIREGRVIHYSFIVQLHQAVHYQTSRLRVQSSLLRLNDGDEIFDVDALGGTLTGNLGLQDLTFAFVALVNVDALGFKVFDYQVDAVIRILHYHLEL